MVQIDELRAMIADEFPAVVIEGPGSHASAVIDRDVEWCVDALLRVPWNELPLDTVVRNRECPIWLTPRQIVCCLPAYLDAVLVAVQEDLNDQFFDCLWFVYQSVADFTKLPPYVSSSQAVVIAEVLVF